MLYLHSYESIPKQLTGPVLDWPTIGQRQLIAESLEVFSKDGGREYDRLRLWQHYDIKSVFKQRKSRALTFRVILHPAFAFYVAFLPLMQMLLTSYYRAVSQIYL